MTGRDVLLAAVLGAHGLKGEVRVKTFTASPSSLNAYGPLHDKTGRFFTLTHLRPGKEGEAVAAFAEIKDRNGAEALKGTELFVAREKLPAPDADEFYLEDLIGLEARDPEGRRVGQVRSVQNYGAGDVLVISSDSGHDVLLAFTKGNVPVVDVKGGFVVITEPDEIDAGDSNISDAEMGDEGGTP